MTMVILPWSSMPIKIEGNESWWIWVDTHRE